MKKSEQFVSRSAGEQVLSKEATSERRNQTDWLKLIRDRRWSKSQKHELISRFECPESIYSQPVIGLREATTGKWLNQQANIDRQALAADQRWLTHDDHRLVCIGQRGFPSQLTHLPDPPIALFVKGDPGYLNDPAVAMVGSRHPTPAGRRIAEQIATGLSAAGITVISGMALGIDAVAHQAVLAAGGITIAVMGCGLDIIYPSRHRRLFGEIAARGCLISEYPIGMQASRYTFPQRNRLVSGLAVGAVIIEAAERSGTLITARLAAEQNQSVMVVPGSPLNRQYAGSHTLLQQGAVLVTCAEDVLMELQNPLRHALLNVSKTAPLQPTRAPHCKLLDYIFCDSTSVDSIISESGLTAAEVSSMLLALEVGGAIALADDGGFVKLV